MSVEQLVEYKLAGENEVLAYKLSHFHFLHYKFIMTRYEIEPGVAGSAANRESYGMT
jgi:hypothetical protein